MSFNTGFLWLHTSGGLSESTAYSTAGVVKTASEISADVAANTLAKIETGYARAVTIKPLLKQGGNGDGTDVGVLNIFGVMGFGEPSQADYDTKEKFLWALGTIDVAHAVGSGVTTASTTAVFSDPSGVDFASQTGGGAGTDQNNETFAKLAAMNTSPPDLADVNIEDVNVGFAIVPGISAFSEIYVSYTGNSLNAASKANALINLHY